LGEISFEHYFNKIPRVADQYHKKGAILELIKTYLLHYFLKYLIKESFEINPI